MSSSEESEGYPEPRTIDLIAEKCLVVATAVASLFAAKCFTASGQNFSRIIVNMMCVWSVLLSWVFFIIIAAIKGMIWYLVFPGLFSSFIFLISLVYITGSIRFLMEQKEVYILDRADYSPRISAEVLILITVILGFFPVTLALMFAIIDTHNNSDVATSIASMMQSFIIYATTFVLWVPYAFCANPRQTAIV